MADAKKLLGGLGKVSERLLAGGEELTAAQRAEAGRKAAALIKTQPQVKASEALGQQMEKGMKRTTTTQADRTRVGGGNIGGAPFSAISEADPAYAGKVWGVMDEGTAARLKNLTDDETAWTTMLGSANQLKTNPIVFDKLKRQFIDSMKQGNLSPELEAKINHNLALNFGEGASIRDPKIWRKADTFEKRAALADVMMGQGIAPSKGGIAIGGEKSGKGVIFRPTDTIKRETEPSLLHTEHGGDVPTFAAGPRLFKLEKESEYRPDLHPGFPTLLTGKDLEVNMIPTPTEVYLPDWHKRFKANNPDRKSPGYYDLALGVKGEGLPSQDLNDEYIRHLLREGFKKGGKVEVDIDAADRRLAKAMETRMAKGGSVDIEAADARLQAAIDARMADGGKVVKGASKVFKKLFADDVMPVAERDANLVKFLAPSAEKRRMYHVSKEPNITEFKSRHQMTEDSHDRDAVFLSPRPEFTNSFARGEGTTTYPVYAQIEKPFDFDNPEHLNKVKETYLDMYHNPDSDLYDPHMLPSERSMAVHTFNKRVDNLPDDENNWARIENQDFQDVLKDLGFDSFYTRERGTKNLGVYDGSRIKSAIGNRGTYDINENDISKAEGGGAFKKLEFMADGGKLVKGLGKVGKKLLADPESKIVQPPSIVIPSEISQLKEYVLQQQGKQGAKRVERAADEVPNLESMYQQQALRRAFNDDNASALMVINPADFEKYARPLNDVTNRAATDSQIFVNRKNKMNTDDYVEYLKSVKGFQDVPFLQLDKGEQGLPIVPHIAGHEGRHRNRALANRGEQSSLVRMTPRAELREGFPRNSQEEYLDALQKEMKMTGNMVRPETYTIPRVIDKSIFEQDRRIVRPDIQLPEMFAEGGAAFKKLQFMGGGGITTSGGYFSPEELGVSADEIGLSNKQWNTIKRNAPEVYEWAKQNVKDEASQLKTGKGVKDFALRTGAQYLGGIPDLINLGLMGVDAGFDTKLSSEKPWFGSEQYINAMHKAGMLGENEFPIAETVAGILAPAGLIKKGVKKLRNLPSAKEEPKKRQGGLSAMAR